MNPKNASTSTLRQQNDPDTAPGTINPSEASSARTPAHAPASKAFSIWTEEGEMEQSHKTATAEVSALKGRLAEIENKATTETAQLAGALAASEKAMADTRASVVQEMGASRADLEAAMTRLDRLAASFDKNTSRAKTENSDVPSLAQTGKPAADSIDSLQQQSKTPEGPPAGAPQTPVAP